MYIFMVNSSQGGTSVTLFVNELNYIDQKDKTTVLEKLTFSISPGKSLAISSNITHRQLLIKILEGRILSTNKHIQVNNHHPGNTVQYRSSISFYYDHPYTYDRLTILDHLIFYKKLYSSSKSISDTLEVTQLNEIAKKRTNKLDRSQKKRLQLAILILQDTPVVVFDEPDQNIDQYTKNILFKVIELLLQEEKCLLILTGSTESAITLSEESYVLSSSGLTRINTEIEEEENAISENDEEINGLEKSTPFSPLELNKVVAKLERNLILLDIDEVKFFESASGSVQIHVADTMLPGLYTMNEYETTLQDRHFFRCHRSYLVNLKKVREIVTWTRNSFSLVLDDRTEVPLSKNKIHVLKEMLGIK